MVETKHVIHGCPVIMNLQRESEINNGCGSDDVSDHSDFVVFRGNEIRESDLPTYEAAIHEMAEPRGIFMSYPHIHL